MHLLIANNIAFLTAIISSLNSSWSLLHKLVIHLQFMAKLHLSCNASAWTTLPTNRNSSRVIASLTDPNVLVQYGTLHTHVHSCSCTPL